MHSRISSDQPKKSSNSQDHFIQPSQAEKPRHVRSTNERLSSHYPLDELPIELEQYLTTTDNPHTIFTSLQESRERRFRLLVRRFTNQIQHGCKNSQCNVTTCLSFRKRQAKAPVRPYNDVAARALAWRCAEQYAEANKEIIRNQNTAIKRTSKTNSLSHRNIPDLCWSEPVMPWYEDPTTSIRRVRNYSSGQNATRISTHHDQLAKTHRGNALTDQQGINYPHRTGAVHNLDDVRQEKTQPRIPNGDIKILNIPSNNVAQESDVTMSNESMNVSMINPDEGQRHVTFTESLEDYSSKEQKQIKDTASFTQILYDTQNIKLFDEVYHSSQTCGDNVLEAPKPQAIRAVTQDQAIHDTHERRTTPHTGSTSKIPRVSTFKILPLSAILWLRAVMPYDVQRSPHRDLSTTADHGTYSQFARQSLHFCLSDPFALLSSVRTWIFVHQQPHKMDEVERQRTIKELALKESSVLQTPSGSSLPQPGGIMVAIGMLIAITSIPEVLDHLFAALQHAYILPHWVGSTTRLESPLPSSSEYTPGHTSRNYPQKSFLSKRLQEDTELSDQGYYDAKYLEDEQVVNLCMMVILALQLILALRLQSFNLSRAVPFKNIGEQYSLSRKSGAIFPQAILLGAWSKETDKRSNFQAYTARLDVMDQWSFQRLLDSLGDVIGHRLAIAETKKTRKHHKFRNKKDANIVELLIEQVLKSLQVPDAMMHKQALQSGLIDLLRFIILRRWDRDAIIKKVSPVGGALSLLAGLYQRKYELDIPAVEFEWPFVADAFDEIDMPLAWLTFDEDSTHVHILAYSFLFEPSSLVTYFRAINSVLMKKANESASAVYADARQFLHNLPVNVYGGKEVLSEIRPHMARFFVLTIRRTTMLQDAINQIWRRQKQELMRPLKVRLGKDEGEDGLDHGGVQAEFFRLVFAEALNPDYGMFTIDEKTRMTWFQPGSAEPLYKFEALGILMSLAVYNGITLPVTFPLAFYRKLLDLKVKKLSHIKDGWPDLARGLQQLLDWQDGDVGHVIARTYEFSYEAFGASYTVDMTKVARDDPWPPVKRGLTKDRTMTASVDHRLDTDSTLLLDDNLKNKLSDSPENPRMADQIETTGIATSPNRGKYSAYSPQSVPTIADIEAPLVTNENRALYVKDYVYWLTNKSIALEYSAFAAGFYTCLNRTALSIFTPEHLKTVIEGHHHIDIDGLQATTTYDDYKSTDEVVVWFWQTVRDMSPEQHKKLLEFVTASDRVPVNGIDSIVFIIQRNGESDERLPSSSTCYGRLLLPKYSAKQILKEKLEKAIENSVGFGSL